MRGIRSVGVIACIVACSDSIGTSNDASVADASNEQTQLGSDAGADANKPPPPPCTKWVAPSGSADGHAASITIQAGVDTLAAGDVLCVAAGTYHEQVAVTTSGTATQKITIRALDYGNKPVVDGAYTLPGGPAGGTDYQVANCKEYSDNPNANLGPLPLMACSSSSTGAPMLILQANHVVWDSIDITRSRGNGVVIGNATGGGWYVSDSTVYTDIQFLGSHVSHIREMGIFILYVDTVLFSGNAIEDAGNFAAYDRPQTSEMGWPNALQIDGTNVTVTNSTFFHNWAEGIQLGVPGFVGSKGAENVLLRGNAIWDNWAVGLYIEAIKAATIDANLIYSTTDATYFRSGSPEFCTLIGREGDTYQPSGLVFSNNIVSGCSHLIDFVQYDSSVTYTNFAFYNNTLTNPYAGGNVLTSNMTGMSGFTFQNNIVYAPGGSMIGSFNASPGMSVGYNVWSAAPTKLFAGTGDVVTATPGLTNPSYVPPAGGFDASTIKLVGSSPALGKGTVIAAVTGDYFGTARPTTAYDIGAYQH